MVGEPSPFSFQHTKGKVPLILKEEMLSQQTKGKTGEGSLYPKGRNTLSTTNQGEGSGESSPWFVVERGFLPLG
jgi:hypothetical protein